MGLPNVLQGFFVSFAAFESVLRTFCGCGINYGGPGISRGSSVIEKENGLILSRMHPLQAGEGLWAVLIKKFYGDN